MTDRDILLRAVLADPADDAPRLAYADWCRDHGDPDRADLIQVGCRLARYTAPPPGGYPFRFPPLMQAYCGPLELEVRHALLIGDLAESLAAELLPPAFAVAAVRIDEDGWLVPTDMHGADGPALRVRRGFVEEVRCEPAVWEDHAAHLLAAAPIRAVRLTAWPVPESGYPPHEQFSIRRRGGPWHEWRYLATPGVAPVVSLYEAEWPGVAFHFPAPVEEGADGQTPE